MMTIELTDAQAAFLLVGLSMAREALTERPVPVAGGLWGDRLQSLEDHIRLARISAIAGSL